MWESVDHGLMTGGALCGLAFGVLLQRSRLCVVAAVSNLVLARDFRQLHGYLAAVAVALTGTYLLERGEWVAVAESAYRASALNWAAAGLGGLVFGFGSLLAGGCAGRTLVRVAEGNLGAWITLPAFVFGAMAALFGALLPVRCLLSSLAWDPPGGDGGLAALLGLPPWLPVAVLVASCGLAIWRFGRRTRDPSIILAGVLAGGLVVLGWWWSGDLVADAFDPRAPVSLSIAGPLARSGIALATPDLPALGFGVPFLAALLISALGSALVSGQFHWVAPQSPQVGPCLAGGLLMGVGAIFAGGCNIGNGLTGLSTTSAQSLIALLAMGVGMVLGLRWVQRREV